MEYKCNHCGKAFVSKGNNAKYCQEYACQRARKNKNERASSGRKKESSVSRPVASLSFVETESELKKENEALKKENAALKERTLWMAREIRKWRATYVIDLETGEI